MADNVISDASPGIQDEGIGSITDGNEDWGSAGLRLALSEAVRSGSYVRSDSELTFTNHDGTADEVDITAGVAYLDLSGVTVDYQSSVGGSSPPSYDKTLPVNPAMPVIVPTTVSNVPLQDSTLSSVWLAYDIDGTGPGSAGSVYVRSDDTGSVSAPSHPSVEIGEANPDDSTADTLKNRFGSPTFNSVTADKGVVNDTSTDPSANGELQRNGTDLKAYSGGSVRNLSDIGGGGSVPNWEEDANSPLNSTGSQTATITLNSSYDRVAVLIQDFTNTSGGGQDLGFRVDGVTSGYTYEEIGGTTQSSEPMWVVANIGDGSGITGEFTLEKEASDRIGLMGPVGRPAAAQGIHSGSNGSANSWKVDSITFRGGSGTVTAKARVFGWSGGI